MPIEPIRKTDTFLGESPQNVEFANQRLAEEKPDVPYADVVRAAFQLENTAVSYFYDESDVGGYVDSTYDPFMDLDGYEEYAAKGRFNYANNAEDVAKIKNQIDREIRNRQTVEDYGVPGVVTEIVAGVLDPINIIPVGGTAYKTWNAGGSVLKGAARTAGIGLASSSLAEASLQETQITRTPEESIANISAATFLGGVLGGGVTMLRDKKLLSRVDSDLTIPPPDVDDLALDGAVRLTEDDLNTDLSVGAAQAETTTLAEETLKKAYGIEKLTSFMTPTLRLASSRIVESRRAVQKLVDTPFYYEKNALGIETPVSVERRIRMHDARRAEAITQLDGSYKDYRMRVKGQKGKRLSNQQFREEVGKAMRRGDQHEIPEVAKAAAAYRKHLFDPFKNDAIEMGLLPKDVEVSTATSYLTRVYNKNKIKAKRGDWENIVRGWLRTTGDDLAEVDIVEIADQITDTILGKAEGIINYEAIPLTRGPLKERTFNIPDTLIEDFLESDVELIGQYYARTMAPDVELQRVFGSTKSDGEVAKIRDSYKLQLERAKTEKERIAIDKKMENDVRDVQALWEKLRNRYGIPSDPDSIINRTGRIARNANYLSLLGGVTLSSLPDVARPIMVNGLLPVLRDGLVPFIKRSKGIKLAANEIKQASNALDMVLDTRANSIAEITDPYARGSKFERGLQTLSNKFGKVTLMSQWNTAMKQFSGVVTQTRVINGIRGNKDAEYLAMLGIGQSQRSAIARQLNKYSSKIDGVPYANTNAWDDADAVFAYRAAISKEVDRQIVTPGAGDKPLWMSTEMGKVVGQFKSFAFASTSRVLISGLQEGQMQFYNGVVIAVGLGMLSYYLKQMDAGREVSDDPRVWIAEGVDRSGVLAVFSEVNNIMEKITGGGVGLSRLYGAAPMSRYASRNAVGAMLGPSFGFAQDVFSVTGAAGRGEWTESDTRALRRIIPFQNLMLFRSQIMDPAEEAINEALGVKK